MEDALELARAKDTKERMAGVERLHEVLEASRKSLTASETSALVDCCMDLLKDNNFKVSQGALQALDSAAVLSGDHLKLHFNGLVPAVVDRLGDAKQSVRDAARRLLLTLMQVSSPTIIVERAGSYAWTHKSWRVREEFARTVTSAIGLFAATELPLQRAILPPILQMLNDPNPGVREAAILCIEEMYTQAGTQFRDELQRHHLPASMVKDINARLERIEPQIRSSDGITGNFAAVEIKSASLNPKRSSPKAKSSSREMSLFGEGDITEKPIEPIKVYSEKELIREIEKIASTLVPEKDWSIRIAAMQKVEGYSNTGILKLWLAKLTPLVHDKNTKLKEAAITCIISVYSHFDSTAVLNFIHSLSVEEQNSLRRSLKQYTPRIEVDLMNSLQNKKERQRSKSSYDPSDIVGTSSEEGYIGASKKSHLYSRYLAGSIDSDGGRKWGSTGHIGQAVFDETHENLCQSFDSGSNADGLGSKTKELSYTVNATGQDVGSWSSQVENVDNNVNVEGLSTHPDNNGLMKSDHLGNADFLSHANEAPTEFDLNHYKPKAVDISGMPDTELSIPQILHLISNGNNESPTASKRGALQQLTVASMANDHSIWTQYFNQILTVVLEVSDDSDSSIRELSLALIIEMLKNQKDAMEDSVEIVIEKLLHVTTDIVPKVSNEAEHCLTIILSQYDPFRCLSVIVPLLVTEDEKTLVTCINCLTKLVGRLSQEELMAQLTSFLPALFEAFGNQSADVRKTVVFCLVDIYIMLGKSFLPYLEGLNSTQLRLVTIYANRISQARTGTAVDASHDS
ncbi:hypothetical protein I3760_04G108200 [Carya illinoinensis]|nr:hypothetical protein I3760_04G108200 [Carya illinoinensis]